MVDHDGLIKASIGEFGDGDLEQFIILADRIDMRWD